MAVIFLSGCTAAASTPPSIAKGTGSTSYPPPGNSIAKGAENTFYPAPSKSTSSKIEPTRDPEEATVQGRLLLNGKPYAHGIIYFSKVIQDKNGKDIVVGLDRTSSLNSDLNENGQFKIFNIPPGKYGIVLDLVSQGALLDVPGKKESLLVNVEKGKDINLGDLNYSNLPEP